ncbi:MAG: aminoacyl-tRNA hydrolase [Pseudomonadota bacterium]
MSADYIVIVGLGNPGKEYASHRHNLGFMVADHLCEDCKGSWTAPPEKARLAKVSIEGFRVALVKPMTFMNLSGKAVNPIVNRLGADPARMIVIHDDLDLDAGSVKVKQGGGDGGHRGIRSIAESLRFRDFARIRLGIGRPPADISPVDYVLQSYSPAEIPELKALIKRANRAVRLILTHGVQRAQNLVHSENRADGGAKTAS